MGTIKYRNGMALTEAGDIERWQEYTEELYKNHDGVVTHLELDILEYEFKWSLGSITANEGSGSDELSAELFQTLKDDAVTVYNSQDMEAT